MATTKSIPNTKNKKKTTKYGFPSSYQHLAPLSKIHATRTSVKLLAFIFITSLLYCYPFIISIVNIVAL